MTNIFEVSIDDIKALKDAQLTQLAESLIFAEAWQHGISTRKIETCLSINIADGGKDARIKWHGSPDRTDYLEQETFFQIKATKMPPASCHEEILEKKKGTNQTRVIKPKVLETLDNGGTYVLFCNRDGMNDERLAQFRSALIAAGKDTKYAEEAKFEIFDSTKIKNWTNRHLTSVSMVKSFLGQTLPNTLMTFDACKGYKRYVSKFASNDSIQSLLTEIREVLKKARSIVRIVGLSGLGKTRICLEALSNDEYKRQVAYIDAAPLSPIDVLGFVHSLRNGKQSGILFVDNCSRDLFSMLIDEVTHDENTGLSLITCNSEPEEDPHNCDVFRVLEPGNNDDVIRQILQEKYSNFGVADLDRIVHFADGFPQMAVLLTEAELRKEKSLDKCTDDILVQKMLWGSSAVDPQAGDVIAICSLFESIGNFEGKKSEREFLAATFCKITSEDFYKHIIAFKNRGIIQQIGNYVRLRPKPLAWRLAVNFWSSKSKEFAESLFNENWPPRLIESLCKQMKYISDVPAAHTIAEKLCQPNCPFVSAEGLNTDSGSRVFSALCEVNPEICINWLLKIFDPMSIDDLKLYGPGRRHLVWALEKLCFHKDTFFRAACLMAKFALAENETRISNNATGQFCRLFHIYLSGTQADLSQRLSVLKQLLNHKDGEYESLIVSALSKGLKYSSFHRSVGVDFPGELASVKDYEPNPSEIKEYWTKIANSLIMFAVKTDSNSETAMKALEGFARILVQPGYTKLLSEIIEKVGESKGWHWPDMHTTLNNLMRRSEQAENESKDLILQEIKKLEPKSFENAAEMIVKKASHWNLDKDENGEIIDYSVVSAKSFGKESGAKWPEWKDHIDCLLTGELRQGSSFAIGIFESITEAGAKELINCCFNKVKEIDPQKLNLTFFGALLAEQNQKDSDFVASIVTEMTQTENLIPSIPWLVCRIGLKNDSILLCLKLLESGKLQPDEFYTFGYGSVLNDIDPKIVLEMTEALTRKNDKGQVVSLFLLHMYSFRNAERFSSIEDGMRSLLLTPELLVKVVELNSGLLHDWAENMRVFINKNDAVVAKHLALEAVSLSKGETDAIYKVDFHLEPLIRVILKSFIAETWSILSNGLLSDEWSEHWNMTILMCSKIDPENKPGPLFDLSDDFLMQWCSEIGLKAVEIVAERMPMIRKASHGPELSSLAKKVIDEYGDNEIILSKLSANLGSFLAVGSLSPMYDERRKVLEPLLSHSKSSVQDWARDEIASAETSSEWWEKRDSELRHGIYDS